MRRHNSRIVTSGLESNLGSEYRVGDDIQPGEVEVVLALVDRVATVRGLLLENGEPQAAIVELSIDTQNSSPALSAIDAMALFIRFEEVPDLIERLRHLLNDIPTAKRRSTRPPA